MSDPTTFKQAYSTLQKHAQTLRSQQEPDIDNLTKIVGESVEAYRVCRERIAAVEKALEQALGDATVDPTAAPAQVSDSPSDGSGDDIPF